MMFYNRYIYFILFILSPFVLFVFFVVFSRLQTRKCGGRWAAPIAWTAAMTRFTSASLKSG
jgi:hypothetical protein